MLNNQEIQTPVLIEDLGQMYPTETSSRKYRYGIYKCSCGKVFKCQSTHVNTGHTTSCGCSHRYANITHNMSKHRLYATWHSMIERCTNRNHINFNKYGGAGIKVCDRWLTLKNFISDMYGSYAEGLTLDRINTYGNYEPSNCRWATKSIQARNTRLISSKNTSGYRGVVKEKKTGRWNSRICVDNVRIQIGTYATAEEASYAYDKYVLDNNLEHTTNKKDIK